MRDSDIMVKKSEIEEELLLYIDWYYRHENSEEIEKVIKICDDSSDFEQAWTDYEDQQLAWFFIDKFNFDIRTMLEAIVELRKKGEADFAQEQLDKIKDLRGL